MTRSLARVYAVLAASLTFFLAWAAVAAHPWRSTHRDPRLVALDERRTQLSQEAQRVRRVLQRRYRAYRVAYRARERAIAHVRAEQRRLDVLAAQARARYLASAPVHTVTVYSGTAPAGPTPAPSAGSAVAVSAPLPAPPAAAAPPPAAPPAVAAVPAVTVTHTS